jgi:hypothetical protein
MLLQNFQDRIYIMLAATDESLAENVRHALDAAASAIPEASQSGLSVKVHGTFDYHHGSKECKPPTAEITRYF